MSDNENQQTDDDDENDLSLDRLSEAYAEVLRQQAGAESPGKKRGRGQLVAEKMGREEDDSDQADLEEDQDADRSSTKRDDNAACPVTPESIVESILFVGVPRGKKLTYKKIASVMRDVSPKEVRAIAKRLDEQYRKEDTAFRIKTESQSVRMVLAEDLADLQDEFFGRNREATLSQAAIDILAVVAYRQPIGREEIEKARNKPVSGILKQLVSRELLSVEANKENAKRKLYSTTDRFLDLFHLTELADLPQAHDVSEFEEFE